MSDWWTYGLSDFLMFSPQAYWRLVARYNAAWWPAQLPAAAAGAALVLLVLLVHRKAWGRRAALALLAVAWAWVGWAFHWQRYAEIFLAAPFLAAACAVQAAWLAGAALLPAGRDPAPPCAARAAGRVLLLAALFFPLLAALPGQGPGAAEVFGFMPDPTALATLGVLLALRGVRAWLRIALAVLPALSLLLGGATRWLLG